MTEQEMMEIHPPYLRCVGGEPTACDKQWLRFLSGYLRDWAPEKAGDPLVGLLALMSRFSQHEP